MRFLRTARMRKGDIFLVEQPIGKAFEAGDLRGERRFRLRVRVQLAELKVQRLSCAAIGVQIMRIVCDEVRARLNVRLEQGRRELGNARIESRDPSGFLFGVLRRLCQYERADGFAADEEERKEDKDQQPASQAHASRVTAIEEERSLVRRTYDCCTCMGEYYCKLPPRRSGLGGSFTSRTKGLGHARNGPVIGGPLYV